jgi:hypothetical protein
MGRPANAPVNRSAVFEVAFAYGLPANDSTGCSRASHQKTKSEE